MTDTSSWFELFHVAPIISKLYNVNILSYDNFDNNNSLNKKTHLFSKSLIEDEVIYEQFDYWHEPLLNRTIHIVGDCHIHFQYFRPTIKRRTERDIK